MKRQTYTPISVFLGTFDNAEDALLEQQDYDFQEWALQVESEMQ